MINNSKKKYYIYKSNVNIILFALSLSSAFYNIEASIKQYYQNIITKSQDFFTRNKTEFFNKEYNTNNFNTINIDNIKGNINIKTWNQNKTEIKAIKKALPKYLENTTIKTEIKNKQLYITTVAKDDKTDVNYNLILPKSINIYISLNKGNIKIQNISGNIQTTICKSGDINIINSQKTVIAKTQKGKISLKVEGIQKPDTLFLDNSNGLVIIDLPKESNLDLQLSTQKGQITSKQEIILNSKKTILNKEYWNQIKKEVNGKIKKGGSSLIVEVKKGNIKLEEYQ